MRGVRTVKMEELSEEQIAAARRRRSRDRCAKLACLLGRTVPCKLNVITAQKA